MDVEKILNDVSSHANTMFDMGEKSGMRNAIIRLQRYQLEQLAVISTQYKIGAIEDCIKELEKVS